ncbi:hypothetical protein GWK47_003049 [Chionoecetes opilio]|uniref:Uncharacterized protein n=1 Tax=Chionoecetes opilio TaxID=41210 RepID=A0A8J8WE52_CHIOP|nr:hypothetical protein GWK47_003049 [Chionoecetes opilio]
MEKYHSLTPASDGTLWVAFGKLEKFHVPGFNPYAMLWEKIGNGIAYVPHFTVRKTTSAFFRKRGKNRFGGLGMPSWRCGAFKNFINPLHAVTVNCKLFQLLKRFPVSTINDNLDSVNEAVGNSSHRKQAREKDSPQRKNPFCSTHCPASTKRESGNQDKCEQKPNPRGFWDGL